MQTRGYADSTTREHHGKTLWSMVSGEPYLQLWYFSKPQFDLSKNFPDSPSIKLANPLFKKCITEDEVNCLPDALALLREIDALLSTIDLGGEILKQDAVRPCRVCGIGQYSMTVMQDNQKAGRLGFHPEGGLSLRICLCDKCGHVQLFSFQGDDLPPAWRDRFTTRFNRFPRHIGSRFRVAPYVERQRCVY